MAKKKNYAELEARGIELQTLMAKQARRPYVLEITGTPKAGKTTTIQMVESFFKSCGWRVHILRERAGVCPIPMKGHFFFNTWTAATMLAQVLEVVDQSIDIVILDRGFFDALIWLELQRSRKQVTDEEADAFAKFVLLERWRELVDLTVVMSVDAKTAMKREQLDKLIPRVGSIMNKAALREFNSALDVARRSHGANFRILDRRSASPDQKVDTAALIADVLDQIQEWVDPQIAVLPEPTVRTIFRSSAGVRWSKSISSQLTSAMSFLKRSRAEQDSRVVQIVVCGVPVAQGGVFVFDRTRDKKRLGEYGVHSIWTGQHAEQVPKVKDEDLLGTLRANLARRFRTSLHLNFDFSPEPLGIVWNDDEKNARSKHHMGVFLAVHIDDENVAQSLEDKEFRTHGRGHLATSKFSKIIELTKKDLELESWSLHAVKNGWVKKALPNP